MVATTCEALMKGDAVIQATAHLIMAFRHYYPNQSSQQLLASAEMETLLLIAVGHNPGGKNKARVMSGMKKRGATIHFQPPEWWLRSFAQHSFWLLAAMWCLWSGSVGTHVDGDSKAMAVMTRRWRKGTTCAKVKRYCYRVAPLPSHCASALTTPTISSRASHKYASQSISLPSHGTPSTT